MTLPLALMWLAIGVAAVLAMAGIVAILLIEVGLPQPRQRAQVRSRSGHTRTGQQHTAR